MLTRAIEAGDYATAMTVEMESGYQEEMEAAGMQFVEVDKTPFIAASASVYETMGWAGLKKLRLMLL